MSKDKGKSREIVEIIGDIVARASDGLTIGVHDGYGNFKVIGCPQINYIFGNAQYVKDVLDEWTMSPELRARKFPLIVLFAPVVEHRYPDSRLYSKASLNMVIACATTRELSNEQRLHTSFQETLRPIYNRFIEELKADRRLEIAYDETIPHDYSENYSYGRYGAHTGTGDAVSEPIDAINISKLEIKVKLPNCR